MKKLTALWMMIVMLGMSLPAMGAMSKSKMRENARFLTDRMAYELRLSAMQYDDVYEVNYDFINNIRYIMDDVVRGYPAAVDRYYEFLDYRNDDLRWILSASQYRAFMGVDYFFRPVYTTPSSWLFRIYRVYKDVNHFYFGKPHHYKTYNGGHFRVHFGNVSYYKNHRKDHYHHDFYQGHVNVRPDKNKPKPNDRPKVNPNDNRRPSVNRTPAEAKPSTRPSAGKNEARPGKAEKKPAVSAPPRKNSQSKSEVKPANRNDSRRVNKAATSRSNRRDGSEGRKAVR